MSPEEVLGNLYVVLKRRFGDGEEKEVSFQGNQFLVVRIKGSKGFFGMSTKEGGSYFHFCVWDGLPQQFFPQTTFRLSVREFACHGDKKKCKSICVETREGTRFDNSYTIDSPLYEFIENDVRPLFNRLQKKISPVKMRISKNIKIFFSSDWPYLNLKSKKV